MAGAVRVTVEGQARAVEALVGVSQDATRARQTAYRAAGTRARSLAAKRLARRWAVPMKVLRKRLRWFPNPRRAAREVRLWLGLQHKPRGSEHPRVKRAILTRFGSTVFEAFRDGNLFRRVAGKLAAVRLPIEEGAEEALIESAREAMRDRYVSRLRADFRRRVAKRRTRRS